VDIREVASEAVPQDLDKIRVRRGLVYKTVDTDLHLIFTV